ncbi:hypothetical protein TWF569_011571 [Orbilia oligospora]|uniref:Uncharacterized protein n=1 Tax=Orbilia oligospora TaxID=2813651 RepID=A0A7C8NAI7_ORBOL|nr:hypothetical protein TWF103_000892 [Orbilia oligospora]KAF3094709.1 hypothetical protein TWF102_007500 [Orbilia oligospora]KAF3113005.1 hypothetical protein TWF706_010014 [Orbilia oligospora]KAF3130679.1 hypothetical protein TWF569_011571 [Orbilia oligospora]KAF3133106.1 hypothetical protein TWF594_009320 [Orbilia oligospora]
MTPSFLSIKIRPRNHTPPTHSQKCRIAASPATLVLTAKVAELDIVTVASEERVNKNEWVASYFCREV